jgi:hypothetical protein
MSNRKNPSSPLDIEKLLKVFEADNLEPEINGDTVSFRSSGLETQLKFTDCERETHGGLHLNQVVLIQTEAPELQDLTPYHLAALNRFACMSGLVKIGGRISLISRMPIFREEKAIRAYTDFIAMTALMQSAWLTLIRVCLQVGNNDAMSSIIDLCDDPCRWSAADFRFVGDRLRKKGLVTNDDEGGVTSEFPWEVGAVSTMFHHKTSLFEMRAARNPFLGNGISYKLELPTVFKDEDGPRLAAALNESEVTATEAAPFFGAWCSTDDGGLAFVGFQPNCLRFVGMHPSIALWNLVRSMDVKRLLECAAGRT